MSKQYNTFSRIKKVNTSGIGIGMSMSDGKVQKKVEGKGSHKNSGPQKSKLRSKNVEVDARVCRVCGGCGEIDIFRVYQQRNIAEDMRKCSGVPVRMNDGLPKWLCSECHRLLQCAVKFRDMCRESMGRLLKLNVEQTHPNTQENKVVQQPSGGGKTACVESMKCQISASLIVETETSIGAEVKLNSRAKATDSSNNEVHIKPDNVVKVILDNTGKANLDNVEASLDNYDEEANIHNEGGANMDYDGEENMDNDGEANMDNEEDNQCASSVKVIGASSLKTDSCLDLLGRKCFRCERILDSKMHYEQHRDTCLPRAKYKTNFVEKNQKIKRKGMESNLCETCGKSFSSIYVLNSHRLIHENTFPFKCDTCPYRGKTKSLLRIHERVHKPKRYTCVLCPSAFRTAGNLGVHVRRHTDREPVQCTVCNKSLRNKCALANHMKDVHEPSPATCQVCGAQYKTRRGLRKHSKKVHNIASEYKGRASYLLCHSENADAVT